MKNLFLLLTFLLVATAPASAQLNSAVYRFLELPVSARAAALGGVPITVLDDDPSFGFYNPSLLNPEQDRWVMFNIADYYSDINIGSVIYTQELEDIGTFSAGMQFAKYGTFQYRDENNVLLGEFSAGDYTMQAGLGRQYQNLHYGANLKLIYSSYERYSSFGLATDLGATYYNEDIELLASLVVRNLGVQLSTYQEEREPLPLQVQAGFSKRLEHTPFRFHVILHNLQQFNLTYVNPYTDVVLNLETGEEEIQEPPFSEKIFRHVIVGTELLFSENFHIQVAYNHQRRKELTQLGKKGLTGFSYGVGFRISKFHINFSRSTYHISGAMNYLSLATNFGSWKKEREASSSMVFQP